MAREEIFRTDPQAMYRRFVLQSDSDLGSIADTTVETAFTALAVNPTNENGDRILNLAARSRIHFKALVHVDDNNSTNTLTLKVRLGGVSGTVVATAAALDVDDADVYWIEGDIIIRTIGASGTFDSVTQFREVVGDTRNDHETLAGSVDTTGALDLVVTSDWSADHADNDVTLRHFEAEVWLPATN